MKKIFAFSLIIGLFLFGFKTVRADCDPNNKDCIQNEIIQYQQKISDLQGQANTLSNQIASFNAQISLGELKILQTEDEISLLSGRITEVQSSLNDLTKAFSARALATYEMARMEEPVYFLLSSNVSEAVSKFHYLEAAENSDQALLVRLQGAQTTYEDSKKQSEALQAKLQKEQNSLNVQKMAKAQLLAQTQGSEATYQNLLAQAQAQLAALSSFAQSVGSTLIPHQDLSDGWGKYYNQRDSQWGATALNGTSYSISSAGCLVTSYSMVVSHYGGSLLPNDVATNPANFWSGTAEFNASPVPSANGHSGTSISNPSSNQLVSDFNAGSTVVLGLSKNGGPYPNHYSDHWVVMRSADSGNFKINDPLYPGAMNVSMNDHYSGWAIIQAIVYN